MTEFARGYRAGLEAAAKVADEWGEAASAHGWGSEGEGYAAIAAAIRALPVPDAEWPDDAFVERVCLEMFTMADDTTRDSMKAALRAARRQP